MRLFSFQVIAIYISKDQKEHVPKCVLKGDRRQNVGYTLEPLLHVVLAFLCVHKKKRKSYGWSDMAKLTDMEIRNWIKSGERFEKGAARGADCTYASV